MRLRICSDLHAEMWIYREIPVIIESVIPRDERDKDSILVLAGDVGQFSRYNETLKPIFINLCSRFKYVVYTYGNHEFYSGVWWNKSTEIMWNGKKLPENLIILDGDYRQIDDVVFVGAPLWTNFDNRNPVAMFHGERGISDFECIRKQVGYNSYRISAEDMIERFEHQKKFIFQAIEFFKTEKVVVVTHFMPSSVCVNEQYKGDLLNHYFYSELGNEICHYEKPDIWIHGHTHDSYFGELCNTKIVCNPYGYRNISINTYYNKNLFVEV